MQRKPLIMIATFLSGILVGAVFAGFRLFYPGSESVSSPLAESQAPPAPFPPGRQALLVQAADPAATVIGGATDRGEGAPPDESATPRKEAGPQPVDPWAGEAESIRLLLSRSERLEAELIGLRNRVQGLERRAAAARDGRGGDAEDPPRVRTPEDRREALRAAGVSDDLASELVWLQGQHELDRLELRDQALREGWFGTERYRETLQDIGEGQPDLRAELGEDVYDRFLFASGESNRVRVEGILAGSSAEEAGLQPGDLIERYGGERVFTFAELRRSTSRGERGELVALQIRRADGSIVQSVVPRGPLGVRLDLTRVDPSN